MPALPPGADDPPMTYLTITELAGQGLERFETVQAALPDPEPTGLLARYAGIHDTALVIVAVWASKANADRFEAEDLGPVARLLNHGTCPVRRAIGVAAADVYIAPPAEVP
jgi:hypothetical protein